jgi:dipeptidyl aminopeptidase/acylaminoacyl peptidase
VARDTLKAQQQSGVPDGTILELIAPALPSYDEWLASYEPFVAGEYAWSGLTAELERRPLASIVPRNEYERLEWAVEDGRCCQLVYSSGGLRVSGYIVRPPRLDEPRPTIIHARGGNRELGAIGPLTLLDFLSLAEAGYIVIGSQYRGGPGAEGRDEFGGDDLQDLLSLVPLAHARAEVDARNLFLWAVSRGGMMAALALRTGMRVRAAAMRAPIVDLAEFAALRPDMRDLFEDLMPDYAADPERALARRSAIHWTHELRIPMFIVHAREDQRVPVSQSQRLAEALRSQGREAKLIVYDRDSHLLLLHRARYLDAVTAWFNCHRSASA